MSFNNWDPDVSEFSDGTSPALAFQFTKARENIQDRSMRACQVSIGDGMYASFTAPAQDESSCDSRSVGTEKY